MDDYKVGAKVSYKGGDYIGTISCICDNKMYIDWTPTPQGVLSSARPHTNNYHYPPSDATKNVIKIIDNPLLFVCKRVY